VPALSIASTCVDSAESSAPEKGLPDAELGDGGSYGSEVGVSTSSIIPYAVSGAVHQLSPVAIRARSLADSQPGRCQTEPRR